MAACSSGQLPYGAFWNGTGWDAMGATPEAVCAAIVDQEAAIGGEYEAPNCAITFTDEEGGGPGVPATVTYYVTVVSVCDAGPPEAPASAPTCTASSPCHMELTATQWQQVYDYVGLLLAAALVFAFFAGYRAGNIR